MNPTTNPIALQSKNMYVSALLELMNEKPYNQISISELSDKADLSRRTFYRLFNSMDEILLFHIHSLWAKKSDELYNSSQTVDKAALGFTSQSHFSFIKRIASKIEVLCVFLSSNNTHFALIFASFFKFIHANVSPTFISIRAFPYICVYRKP